MQAFKCNVETQGREEETVEDRASPSAQNWHKLGVYRATKSQY